MCVNYWKRFHRNASVLDVEQMKTEIKTVNKVSII